jgi:hypothetical protein
MDGIVGVDGVITCPIDLDEEIETGFSLLVEFHCSKSLLDVIVRGFY